MHGGAARRGDEAGEAAHPLCPAGQGQLLRFHAGIGEDVRHQLGGAVHLHAQAVTLRAGVKGGQFLAQAPAFRRQPLAGGCKALFAVFVFFGGKADGGEVFIRQPAHRRLQGGGEGDLLPAVIQKLQNSEHGAHFGVAAQIDLGCGGDGDASADERADDAAGVLGAAAHEHDDILQSVGHLFAFGGVVAHGRRLLQHQFCDQLALGRGFALPFAQMLRHRIHAARGRGLLFGRGHELGAHLAQGAGGAALPRRVARRDDGGGGVIDGTAFARHAAGEELVDGVEHGKAAAEVAVEGERPPLGGKFFKFLGEEGGGTAAEAVDGLLRIAHHEHVFAPQAGEDAVLHGVDVLIFVYEHMRVAGVDLGAHGFVFQQAQAAVLEVGKVQPARAALGGGVEAVKGDERLAQAFRRPARREEARQLFFPRRKRSGEFCQLFDLRLERFELFVQRGGGPAALAGLIGARLGRELCFRQNGGGSEDIGRGAQPLGKGLALLQKGDMRPAEQALFQIGLHLSFQRRGAGAKARGAGGKLTLQFGGEGFKAFLAVAGGEGAQKGEVIGAGAHLFVPFQDDLAQGVEPAAARKGGAEGGKGGGLLFQQIFDGLLQGAAAQFFCLGVVEDAEIRLYVRLVKAAAQKPRAEGVQGAHVRRADLGDLFAQAGAHGSIVRAVDGAHQRRPQALFHLGGGELCKGDGEHGRYLCLAREDEGDHLFDHHEGLAAARRGGHQHLPRGGDGRLLFLCGSAFAHCTFLLMTAAVCPPRAFLRRLIALFRLLVALL